MGMVMGFTAITAEEMTAAFADRETARELAGGRQRPGFEHVYLDKSWDGIRFLLRAADIGVDLLEDGAMLDDDGSLSAWTVEKVADAAAALDGVPFADLRGWYDPPGMRRDRVYPDIWDSDWAQDYILNYYRDLRKFFIDTAAKNRAALMTWG